ncbi:MAG: TIGR01777 family oxidoreductase [Verrucomicrobiales bacterium]|nr:TIGR01777 family oxidoreductase [Verrucomicrobiales bacterium]
MNQFRKQTTIHVPAKELADWHLSKGAFRRLSPPWEKIRVGLEPEEITEGSRAEISMKAGPVWTNWIAEHRDVVPGKGFSDIQIDGPFAKWKHVHTFSEKDEQSCELIDEISYRMPFGIFGNIFGSGFVRSKLACTFQYRHAITKMDLERMSGEPSTPPKTIMVTGATGMIGTALECFLQMRGHRIRRVTRHPEQESDIYWDIKEGKLDIPPGENIDAVVHLAGENIAGGRWTEKQKNRILESRREGTRLLSQTIANMERKPEVLLSMSGANYYQQGTESAQDENSPGGDTFLSKVCRIWEDETAPATHAGIRVVNLRSGMVLGPSGGALKKMLPAFRLGLAGPLGSGKQRVAWIALDDLIDIINRALFDSRYTGPVNAVAPQNPANREFTSSLADAVNRPAIIPAPAPALRLALGREMADETLLADLAIAPGKLEDLNYPFRFPDLQSAFEFMI